MTFVTPKPYISYKHIEAKTPTELEVLMLTISVKTMSPPSFTPPTFSNGKWHTWYLHDWSTEVKAKTKLDMENE